MMLPDVSLYRKIVFIPIWSFSGILNILGEKDNEVLMVPSDVGSGWKGISFQQVSGEHSNTPLLSG